MMTTILKLGDGISQRHGQHAADRQCGSEYLTLHPGVEKVTFTGSTAVGRHLAAKCGALGSPIRAANRRRSCGRTRMWRGAVEVLRLRSMRNSGQTCSLKARILVPHARHDQADGEPPPTPRVDSAK
ncbi:aldehyde dehydrogenase family protein [Cypionkella sp.]|uniref:aldehyde dehydrogenase family protein n=1 Tax=Cypionkella sp. TaxID=2811411 RepID=UPI002AC9E6F7|nr:aldehyde dehydrogenase family protein [Cypionkella sp.]